jgi:hypothetical protein
MSVLAALMKSTKFPFLLSVGLALMLGTSVLLAASVSPTAFGQQQTTNTGGNQNMTAATTTTNNTATSTAGALDCQMAASGLGGIVIPNPTGVCDVAVPRQGLQVQDTATGATLNNLLVINPLFEFTQIPSQTAGGATGAANQTMVYGFAEFALMEGELPSAMRMLSNSSWNVVAVHNHVIGESPSMIFAHAVANGDINTLVRDARTVLDALMTQMQTQLSNQTSRAEGGGGAGDGTTGGGTTDGTEGGGGGNATTTTGGNTTTGGGTVGSGGAGGGGTAGGIITGGGTTIGGADSNQTGGSVGGTTGG